MFGIGVAIMVTAAASASAPADLPLTPAFAAQLVSYRNCVLEQVDGMALSDAGQMARRAIAACALSREAVRAQLIADLRATQPALPETVAQRQAGQGLATIDPMIEAVATERAHAQFASLMR
jgi:hypothetical protein